MTSVVANNKGDWPAATLCRFVYSKKIDVYSEGIWFESQL